MTKLLPGIQITREELTKLSQEASTLDAQLGGDIYDGDEALRVLEGATDTTNAIAILNRYALSEQPATFDGTIAGLQIVTERIVRTQEAIRSLPDLVRPAKFRTDMIDVGPYHVAIGASGTVIGGLIGNITQFVATLPEEAAQNPSMVFGAILGGFLTGGLIVLYEYRKNQKAWKEYNAESAMQTQTEKTLKQRLKSLKSIVNRYETEPNALDYLISGHGDDISIGRFYEDKVHFDFSLATFLKKDRQIPREMHMSSTAQSRLEEVNVLTVLRTGRAQTLEEAAHLPQYTPVAVRQVSPIDAIEYAGFLGPVNQDQIILYQHPKLPIGERSVTTKPEVEIYKLEPKLKPAGKNG